VLTWGVSQYNNVLGKLEKIPPTKHKQLKTLFLLGGWFSKGIVGIISQAGTVLAGKLAHSLSGST